MKSIRVFLVIVLTSTLMLGNFLAALRGYRNSMSETQRLFDEQMLQALRSIDDLLRTANHPENFDSLSTLARSAGFELQLVNDEGKVLTRSPNMPNVAVTELKVSNGYVNFAKYRWHFRVERSKVEPAWLIIAERDDLRFRLAESIVIPALAPMLIAVPILACLIWLIVGIGLRPVTALSKELDRRQASNLSPIPLDDLPRELAPLAHAANSVLARLDEAFLRERRFSADAAHELRTPISALRIHFENLASTTQLDHATQTRLTSAIDRLTRIVEQILLLNKLSSEELRRSFVSVDLLELCRRVVSAHSDTIAARSIQLCIDGSATHLWGNAFALETIVSNLLGNALKYTPVDGEVELAVYAKADHAVFEIHDSGPGISPDQQARVFDRFYRIGGDRHDARIEGSGLGLSIVKLAVNLHNAEIAFAPSRFGQGLLVRVQFPTRLEVYGQGHVEN